MQKQIVILAGGKSERFGGKVPKPFVRIWGKQMGEFLGESLRTNISRVFWICGPLLASYDVLGEVTRWWKGGQHHIHHLSYQTRNPVETLFLGIQHFIQQNVLDKHLPILVLDNDNYYDNSICRFFEPHFFDTFSAAVLTRRVKPTDSEKYGFLKIEDSTVLQVREKKRGWGETHISLGGYAFSSGTFLLNTLSKTDAKNLLECLPVDSKHVTYVQTDSTYSIGTPEDLQEAEQLCPEKFGWHRARIVVDLDNTLVTYPREYGNYSSVVFRKDILDWLTYVQSKGAKLILSTARRSETHGGNEGKAIADIGMNVLKQLQDTNLTWEEVHFGKAFGDIYLDDRGYNPNTELWQTEVGDFHLQVGPNQDSFESILEKSKHNIRKEKIDVIFKTGTPREILGYKYYIETIQQFPTLRNLFPKLYSYQQKSESNYEMMIQYIRGIEASVLLSNGFLRENEWNAIFMKLKDLHSYYLPECKWTKDELEHQWIGKTIYRMEIYKSHYSDPLVKETLQRVHTILTEYITKRSINDLPYTVIHGDAWLSNILFNDKNEIFFIDMRGKNSMNSFTITGDEMYDYAKIGTSILGMDCAVFNLPDIDFQVRMRYWTMLLDKVPFVYKKYVPAMVFSLMLTALWNYPEEIRTKIISYVKSYLFLLNENV